METVLSKRLKAVRERKGMAQKFVASKLDIKPNTLSGYESGRREPDASTLKSLAKFYEVSVDYLLGEEYKEPAADPFKDAEVLMFSDKEGFDNLSEEDKQELKDLLNDQLEYWIDKKNRD